MNFEPLTIVFIEKHFFFVPFHMTSVLIPLNPLPLKLDAVERRFNEPLYNK